MQSATVRFDDNPALTVSTVGRLDVDIYNLLVDPASPSAIYHTGVVEVKQIMIGYLSLNKIPQKGICISSNYI